MRTNYTEMTNKELFTLCQERTTQGVTSKSKKADLIAALEALETPAVATYKAVADRLLSMGYALKGSLADNGKSRFWVLSTVKTGKALCQVIYSKRKGTTYEVKSGTEFTGSIYHEGWASKYDRKGLSINDVLDIVCELNGKKYVKKEEA